MYGYIVVNQAEMKFREFDEYHGYYCGLCQQLMERYGILGQITLTYDMTFLALLLSALYEPETKVSMNRCTVHPLHKHRMATNQYTAYAADMNVLLFAEKCQDDWRDERKFSRKVLASSLKSANRKIRHLYPVKVKKIRTNLNRIYRAEQKNVLDIDRMSGYYGNVMAEIFVYREDEWAQYLRKMGFYLGKFVYLLDAFEDVEQDIKEGNYNPFKKVFTEDEENFEKNCKDLLTMMMTDCSREFEKLPIIQNVEILRNILYSGVWTRFDQTVENRKRQQEKEHA